MPGEGILQEDFFQRIIDVQWRRGGAFVAPASGKILFSKKRSTASAGAAPRAALLSSSSDWETFDPIGGGNGNYIGGSAAVINDKAVFVVVGGYSGRNGLGPYDGGSGSMIMMSRDGASWQQVHDVRWTFEGASGGDPQPGDTWTVNQLQDVVFSNGKFYAVMWQQKTRWLAGSSEGDVLYSSPDGVSWSEAGGSMSDTSAGPLPLDTKSSIAPYCTKPENQGGIPDGYQAYDADTNTFIKPAGLTGYNLWGPTYTNINNPPSQVISTPGGSQTVSMPCFAVARGDSDWMAVGGDRNGTTGRIDMKSGSDKAWKNSYTGGDFISAIAGVPSSAMPA